ncbi:MAG: molecular chaperone DnaK [bacterium]
MAANHVIGIDLGTSNSCIASLVGGEPGVIQNLEGDRTTPSVVAFGRNGERMIGQPAKRQAVVNPTNTIFSIKRFIGRSYRSRQVQENLERFPFRLASSSGGDVRFDIEGRRFSPEELSSMIVAKLKSEAEQSLGAEVRNAVIAVPAYFDDRQRSATKDAGRIAGLGDIQIINEPTAAALAYGLHRQQNQLLAVYDLGGGTFDVSVLQQLGGKFRVLASCGDAYLGGDDFDRVLIDWLIEEFQRAAGVPLPTEPTVLQRLKNAVEQAKRDLSFSQSVRITVPFLAGGRSGPVHLDVELDRQRFEQLVGPLVDRTLGPCATALSDAGIKPQDIEAVVVVGGQSRSPIVQARVAQFFGRAPVRGINPDEAVAMGASVTAALGAGQLPGYELRDVTPLSIGIETAGGAFTKIIPRNTPLPATAKRVFTTTEDNQIIIRVHVLQGERELAKDNRSLGQFDLVGVRAAPKGTPSIAIEFEVSEEGRVHVTAKDEDTGRFQTVRVSGRGGLTETEVDRMVEDAQLHRAVDEQAREWLAVRNRGLSLVYQTERLLTDPTAPLMPIFRERLHAMVSEFKRHLARSVAPQDRHSIEERLSELVALLRELEYES